MSDSAKPWTQPMPDAQFKLMRDILAAPSPVGLEAAMTYGVLKPHFESFAPKSWHLHQFKGNAGVVLDTHPGRDDMFKVMLIGHADKIRMQVRSIGEDGKIWINTDSFLPTVLIGHEVKLFSEDPDAPGSYRCIEGGTVEALGAIHFSDPAQRDGSKGLKKEQIYLDLQIHGENKKQQVLNLGVRPGDSIIFDRPIRPGFSPNTFYGAYLDNGLGCFVAAEVARLIAEAGGTQNVRVLFAIASYEEIGRFGSRVMAGEMKPDALIGVDVNHDYVAAPGIGDKRMQPLEMGKGFTMAVALLPVNSSTALSPRPRKSRTFRCSAILSVWIRVPMAWQAYWRLSTVPLPRLVSPSVICTPSQKPVIPRTCWRLFTPSPIPCKPWMPYLTCSVNSWITTRA